MENYKELLDYIQQIFDTKFDSLNTKLDLINTSLVSNHSKLENRVMQCEEELTILQNRPRDEKINVKNEILKTIIHWGIPILIVLIILTISNGQLLQVMGI